MDKTSAIPTLKALLERIDALERENMRLRTENECLKLELAAARKNSRNSSKPPSSDFVKPPRPGGKGKRRLGGQPGHEPHFRQPFTPEQLDETHGIDPPMPLCSCGGRLTPSPAEDQVQQQIELRENPLLRREYRARAYRCAACGAFHREKLPPHVRRTGFIGDRLAAALAFMNTKGHASYSALAAFLKDVFGEPVSRGQLAKTFRRVSAALEAPCGEALDRLRKEPALHIDETGHREGGKRFWTWVFRAADFTVFHIDKTRSAQVLQDVLGAEYRGTIGCDYFSAYHKYLKDTDGDAQFCLAHLIREIRFLEEHAAPGTRKYAGRALAAVRRLFRAYHRAAANPESSRRALVKAGEELRRTIVRAPPEPKAKNIAKRFRENGDAYLRFISRPGIEPTNNRAEQAIRQVVIDRASSQGTRSPNGRAYKERLWTVLSTCSARGTSAYTFLLDALAARANHTVVPSLLTL